MSLSPKHARFVAEYLKDLNGTQAAIRAGYSAKSARVQGTRLLADAAIAAAVAKKTAERLAKADLTAERVLEEYRRLAFIDVRSYFDEQGNVKPMSQLTADQGAALASLEVVLKNAEAGDGHTDRVHKFKVWDKTRALEALAKHFGLLADQMHVKLTVTLEDLVAGAADAHDPD